MAKFDWTGANHFTTYKGHIAQKEQPKTIRRLDSAGVLPLDHPIRDCSAAFCGVAEEDIRRCPSRTLNCPTVCHFAKALFDEKVLPEVHDRLAVGRPEQSMVTIMRRRHRVTVDRVRSFDKSRIERSVSRYMSKLRAKVGVSFVAWGRVEADVSENGLVRFHIHFIVYSDVALPRNCFKAFAPGERRGSMAKPLRNIRGVTYTHKGGITGAERANDVKSNGRRRSKPSARVQLEYQMFQLPMTHRDATFMFGCRFDGLKLTLIPWPYRRPSRK